MVFQNDVGAEMKVSKKSKNTLFVISNKVRNLGLPIG